MRKTLSTREKKRVMDWQYAKGVTNTALADRLGTHESTVSRYIAGKTSMPAKTWEALEKMIGGAK